MMRGKRLGQFVALLAVGVAVWFGNIGSVRSDANHATPPSGTPTTLGTPAGGWKPWQTIEMTDALTNVTFTLADFSGKTVVVEPMATWCGACREQLRNMREALNTVDANEIVFVAVSVETDLSSKDLAAYAKREGFDWRFVVASPELLRALVDEFGRSVINPPATPHFFIRPNGSFSELETGMMSAPDLVAWFSTAPTD